MIWESKKNIFLVELADVDTGQLYLNFGSSYKTSDFMVDSLSLWWETLALNEKQQTDVIQIKVDNGPENSGIRTQFLKRMVEFADWTRKSIQLLYFPPYHSNTMVLFEAKYDLERIKSDY